MEALGLVETSRHVCLKNLLALATRPVSGAPQYLAYHLAGPAKPEVARPFGRSAAIESEHMPLPVREEPRSFCFEIVVLPSFSSADRFVDDGETSIES